MNERDEVLHIALPDDWEAARANGEYRVSTRNRSLDDEGFIHCSYPHQLEAVANRFYADVAELVIVHLDIDAIAPNVRPEPAAAGESELFPHLYSPILASAVVATTWWDRDDDGMWHKPVTM